MQRIDAPDATSDNRFTSGDPTIPIPATTVTADWLNSVQEELVNAITAAGITLDKNRSDQLKTAMGILIEAGVGTVTPASIGAVPVGRTLTAGTGLTGGGALDANRTFAVKYGSTAGTACQGNDPRLEGNRPPMAHAASHASGGTDAITPAAIGAAAVAHTTPAATTTVAGHVKLNNTVSSTSSTEAATANAVKVAYDKAVAAANAASSAQTVAGAKAPLPQPAAGVGQFIGIGVQNTPSYTLGQGGTWLVSFLSMKSGSVGDSTRILRSQVGLFAGGTFIDVRNGTVQPEWVVGFVWRIA